MINAAIRIPTPEEIKARRARLGFGPANVNRKPKPAPVVKVVDMTQEWRRLASMFDDHVIRHRVNVTSKWYVRYAKARAVELGFESFDDLLAGGRVRHYALGRQIITYEIRQFEQKISYPELGRFFGGQDHSTLINSVERIEAMGHRAAIAELAQIMTKLAAPKHHEKSQLTDEDVIEIRGLHGKMRRSDICDIFGISTRTFSEIVSGRTWKHLL